MRKPSANGKETKAWNKAASAATNESVPLLSQSSATSYSRTSATNIRSRRASGSRSPHQIDMNKTHEDNSVDKEIQQSYNILQDNPSGSASLGDGSLSVNSSHSGGSRSFHQTRRHYVARGSGSGEHPLLEIPEEVYSIRKSALQVLKPLTRTWVSREIRVHPATMFAY